MSEKVLFSSFPKQDEFFESVFDDDINFVLYGGAIRGGKTFAGLGALILLSQVYPGSRWAVVRKDTMTLDQNTLPAWHKIKPSNIIKHYNGKTRVCTFTNESQIIFFPESYHRDKDLNRWKGLEVNGFLLEEVNELQRGSFFKALERAGSWVIPGSDKQPIPKVLATCNPTQGWVKDDFYTKWEKGNLPAHQKYISSTIFDNPYIPEDYKKSLQNLPRYEYEVYVMGNWNVQLKTGGEFFKSFDIEQHVKPEMLVPDEPIHVSIDNNVWPYIAITIWQVRKIKGGWKVVQVGEVCAKDPDNTASAAGKETVRFLKRNSLDITTLYLYGDPTTQARNTIDEAKKTFLQKFQEKIESNYTVHKRMFRKAPPVATTGDFINSLYESNVFGIQISISETCTNSINDYIETKENKDGGILKKRVVDSKTGISFEKNGHLSDTKRYFLCKLFESEYQKFVNRFSNPEEYHIAKPNRIIRGGI